MEKEYSIELENVTKEYKVFASPKRRLLYSATRLKRFEPTLFSAVTNVDIKIEKGEILGIIGKNGAGKSTILKLITGVSFPTRGNIHVKGRISSLLELGAGFNPELTGIENIFFQANLLGIEEEEMQKRLPDILSFADIGEFINQPVKNYSSGMFARLAFSTAIHVDPEILIVDEVLAVGDIAFQFKCIEKMKEFAKKGVTIIFVTHSMMSLYRFCNRAIWIDKGKVIMDGTVEDVVPRYEDDLKKQDVDTDVYNSVHSKILTLHSTSIYKTDDKNKDIFSHDSFSLLLEYTLHQSLNENPYVAISIIKDGLTYDIFGIYPTQERYSLPKEKGKYRLTIDFVNPSINVGSYEIYTGIMERSGISQLYFGRSGALEIQGTLDTLGLIDIPHNVQVTKLKQGGE